MTIQRIIEIPLKEVQTEKAKAMDVTLGGCCIVCGRRLMPKTTKYVQLLTNGNIISTDQDIEGSQGFFTVGPECEKRLVITFAF